jgi:hypothetical protein
MNNNNLDKLFQEQLKNLEATPNKKVWNNIASKLKKKKRRVLPIWWFTTGVAAILLLGIFLFPFSKQETVLDNKDSKIIITKIPKNKVETVNKTEVESVKLNKIVKEQIIIADKKLKTKSNIKIIKKGLVSEKNAVEKIFLANNPSNNIKKDSLKSKKSFATLNKLNIFDKKNKIAQKKKIKVKKPDKKLTTKKIELSNLVEKKDTVFNAKKLKNKWSVAPVFAVLNSNSFSNSSPVNKNLSNSTEGKSSFSYGFQVGYKINKRWSIQTGVHLQEVSFVNKQVTAISSIVTEESSIAFQNGESLSFSGSTSQNVASNSLVDIKNLNTSYLTGNLNQKFGYLEIPLELKYNFITTKKLNTQIVAGFSSLFLNKNQINFNTQFISEMGKATNLNKINFSGNLGLDFGYSLNRNWSINLTPMFKAQLNTFSEESNGFLPVNIGVYSGIKYTF